MNTFVVCINNESNPASLILGKVYPRLPDPPGESHGMIRVVDEDIDEADGYLYDADMFVPVELPEDVQQLLLAKYQSAAV
ncbi:MAG: hypothetical protein HYV26_02995 [Candidatus Hydrogenedentes bacterium]|nr:hypothetical protein [Candidatus Hydrogenedentota bacterium]MBI3117923.1 hypothetical protein [Candidatus Hydrogenedentota bacterium]